MIHRLLRTQGFTIVELLIVVAVIGILATLGIISYTGIQGGARDKGVLSDVEALEGVQADYSIKNNVSGKAWYSGQSGTNGAADIDLAFIPTKGNVIDVVVNTTDYCIRVYNPNAKTYKSLATAYKKESSPGSCTTLSASALAISDDASSGGGGSGSTYTNLVWTSQTGSGSRNWDSVDMSSDGAKIVATVSGTGYIYRSLDSGVTWAPITTAGSRSWYKATISDDGTKLAASATTGFYNSTDSGVTWTLRSITLSPGDSAASYGNLLNASANGMKLVMWIFNDDLCGGYYYVSSNAGTTWSATNVYACGALVLVSADGTKMLGYSTYGYINRSSDGGVTWSQNTPSIGGQYWSSGSRTSTMSATSLSNLTQPSTNSKLWKSTDNGLTWTQITSLPVTTYVTASSADGRIQYAATSITSGSVYVSTDFGTTWLEKTGTSARNWRSIVTSDDGTFVVGIYGTGYIYTGTFQ